MPQSLPCPACGYLMSPLEKECPRCANFKAQGKTAPPVLAGPPLPVAPSPPPFPKPLPTPLTVLPPAQAQQPQGPPAQVIYNQVTVKGSSAGWWAAAMVLTFGTPLGCVIIPAVVIAAACVLMFGLMAWPLIAAMVGVSIIAKLPEHVLPARHKPPVMVVIVFVGVIGLAAVWPHSASGPPSVSTRR